MSVFFIALLCVSIVGMAAILSIKHWETSRNKLILSRVRLKAGEALGAGLNFVEKRAPAIVRTKTSRGYAAALVLLHRGVAWTVLFAENMLEKTLHTLRHTTGRRGDGKVSEFLREVAEHKKLLQDSSSDKKPNAIYEE